MSTPGRTLAHASTGRPIAPSGRNAIAESETPAQHAMADYILDLSSEMSGMARGAGLDLLGYLLELVQLEAKRVKAQTTVSSDG